MRWLEKADAAKAACRGLAGAALLTLLPAAATADGGPRETRLRKGPYLTQLSDSGVDVRVELDASAPINVECWPDSSGAPTRPGLQTIEDRAASDMHVVRVSRLAPATRYAYSIVVKEKTLGGGRFTTAPRPDSGAPLKFLVYGDDRTDPTAHAAVARALASVPCDFLVNTGDVVENGGSAEDWQSFFAVEASLLRDHPLFVSIGNHELSDDQAGANFARYLGFADGAGQVHPYGTARLGNVRFFFLNAMHDWDGGEERRWLERELSQADGEAGLVWRIAVLHQGPWSSGPHGGSTLLTRARIPELLVAHRVDLLLAGHDHLYERGESGGLKYVISGGGGAPLYRVVQNVPSTRKAESTHHFVEFSTSAADIRLVARRIDGSVLDRCGFQKADGGAASAGDWDCDVPPEPSPQVTPPPAAAPRPTSGGRTCGFARPGRSAPAAIGACLVGLAMAVVAARAARRQKTGGSRP